MITWGQTQSIFQISWALNAAYFSFREIQAPRFKQVEELLDYLENEADSTLKLLFNLGEPPVENEFRMKWFHYRDQLSGIRGNASGEKFGFSGLQENAAAIEKGGRYITIAAAALSLALLIYSVMAYNDPLSGVLFGILCAVCFLPSITLILYNLDVSRDFFLGSFKGLEDRKRQLIDLRRFLIERELPEYRRSLGGHRVDL
jgi:hypothetical protein